MSRSEESSSTKRLAILAGVGGLIVVAVPLLALLAPLFLFTLMAAGLEDDPSEEGLREIPTVMHEAYLSAVEQLPDIAPRCEGLHWSVLASIGRIESGHAGGSEISENGDTDPWIIGPRLDGSGAGGNTVPFYDTDEGRWDRDTEYDAAVGPMQFIPTSWEIFGQDGNGDGQKDPHNVFDATLAAAAHLCGSAAVDLSDPEQLRAAIFSYNRSEAYVDEVLMWADRYRGGGDLPGGPISDTGPPGAWGGHSNGYIPASEMCPLPWNPAQMLRCDAASGLAQLNTEFRDRFGHDLPVLDSYRSFDRQVYLKWLWCQRGACHMAAEPGYSNHGWALAVDFSGGIAAWDTAEHVWMKQNAPAYNWYNPGWAQRGLGKEEPWHWEWGQ